MRLDWPLCQPLLFCDRVWLLAQQQATHQTMAMRRFRWLKSSLQLSCARDVL
jgi:hypothetical protein